MEGADRTGVLSCRIRARLRIRFADDGEFENRGNDRVDQWPQVRHDAKLDLCLSRRISCDVQDLTPLGDPSTYFFYHEGHPSTAVHRIVGKKLFEEIASRSPRPR